MARCRSPHSSFYRTLRTQSTLVTHTELIDHLWPGTFIQPEVLKTHIRALRSTLGDDARKPLYIETHHRRGYRFIAPAFEPGESQKGAEQTALATVVGQEGDIEVLRAGFGLACGRKPQLVFVIGEVGIGKTQLVNSFEREVLFGTSRARVVRGQCFKQFGVHEPYYPLLEAISNLIRQPGSEAVVEVLATHAPTWLIQFPAFVKLDQTDRLQLELAGATRERMLRELYDLMEKTAAESPLLVILEDVHWADPNTISWLSAFAYGKRSTKLMVVATFRPDEVALGSIPLRELRQGLLSRKLCTEIELQRLSGSAMEQFLERRAPGGLVPPGLTEFVFRHTRGNPFFSEVMLEHLVSQGILSNSGGSWVFRPAEGRQVEMVPETIRKLLEDNIYFMLSDAERWVLEAASVCGTSFTAACMEAAVGRSQEDVEDVCYDLSRRGLFIKPLGSVDLPDGSSLGQFEFVHVLYCEVFYRRIPPSRQIRFHRQIAQKMESLYCKSPNEVAARLAYHFEKCSAWTLAAKYLLIVAKTESQRFAYDDALEALNHAMELLPRAPDSEAELLRYKLLTCLAEVHTLTDDFQYAIEELEAAGRSSVLAGNNGAKSQLLSNLAFMYARTNGDRCVAAADEAMELSLREEDSALRAVARMNASFWRVMCEGWNTHFADECTDAFEELQLSSDFAAKARSQIVFGFIQNLGSRYREGLFNIRSGTQELFRAGVPFYQFGERTEIWVLIHAGEWGEALTKAQTRIDSARRNGNRVNESFWQVMQAWIHQNAFDHAGVIELCKLSSGFLQKRELLWIQRLCLTLQAMSSACTGSVEDAREYLMQAREKTESPHAWYEWYWTILRYQCEFEISMRTGALKEAQQIAQLYLSASLGTAERTWQALAWEASARVAILNGDSSHAGSCIESAIEVMKGYEVPLAHWRVHRTAMLVYPDHAKHHQALAANTAKQQANSLRDYPALRKSFVSSLEVKDLF